MTTPDLFPTLPGLAWSVYKRPTFQTRIATHVSGREVRAADWAYPLYEFELQYEFLRAGAEQELQSLVGFYLRAQGQFGSFRYLDPGDFSVTSGVLGEGDGSTVAFSFIRDLGGWIDPVGWVESLAGVRVGGVAQASGFTLQAPATLVFNAAPPSGSQVSADFTFSYLCRFLDDKHEYENFMNNLWLNKSVKFRSVRP